MAGVSGVSDLTTTLDEVKASQEEKKLNIRGSSELGKDEFLQLLVCQLQNQDPVQMSFQTSQRFLHLYNTFRQKLLHTYALPAQEYL